jgi:hypothetical protein
MIPVWGRDVNDIDLGRTQQLPVIAISPRNPEPGSGALDAPRHVAQARHLDPEPAQRFDMNRADEARADDSGAELVDRFG